MKLHLDSVYRNRWIEFKMVSGTVMDSREVNWREVAWKNVEEIAVHIKGKVHKVTKKGKKNFLCFMNFRWAGIVEGAEINEWSVGWTDGVKCYLSNYDFYTGVLMNTEIEPLKTYKKHIHPDIKVPLFPSM